MIIDWYWNLSEQLKWGASEVRKLLILSLVPELVEGCRSIIGVLNEPVIRWFEINIREALS